MPITTTPGYASADAERLYQQSVGLLDQVVGGIARRHGLSADEASGFSGAMRRSLVANDYEMLRRFRGRSTLRTYLIVVSERHLLDSRPRGLPNRVALAIHESNPVR